MSEPTDATAGTNTPASINPAVDEVTTVLADFGVEVEVIDRIKQDLGVTSADDLSVLGEADLVNAGMKVVQARKLLASLTPAATVTDAAAFSTVALDVLPSVPDDISWLSALKSGGVLKVDPSTVISAIRAALASAVGLYDIPALLVTAMEMFADTNDEQVDPEFFKLRNQLVRRNYGDLFSVIDGLDGRYVTEERKKELFRRINEFLWPSVISFFDQLKSWQEAWMQGAANPAILMATFMTGGSGGLTMPPGIMQPPDTGVLRDHADAVKDSINRVFAGTGVQIAAALAYDATQIRQSLENPRLPSMVGAANRDQMLRQLGVAVNATYPRLEVNVTRFVLGTMQASDQPAGNEELRYFSALYMLGTQIPWDDLNSRGKFSGIGGTTRL